MEFLMRTIDGGGMASWEYTHHVLLITCQQGRAEVDLGARAHTHTRSRRGLTEMSDAIIIDTLNLITHG